MLDHIVNGECFMQLVSQYVWQIVPVRRIQLTVVGILLLSLFGGAIHAYAGELLRNNTFSLNLQNWRKAAALASWSPLVGTTLDLEPSAEFRGDLLWQPLNILNPAGEVFTFEVEMARIEADMGSAITFFIEFVDDAGKVQRAQLLSVSNSQTPLLGEGWLSLQRQWHCPPTAQGLTKLIIARTGSGHLRLQKPSLTHDTLTNGPIPTVTAMTPESGPYKTNITITGQNFGAVQGKVFINKVSEDWFAWNSLSIVSWQDNTIVAKVALDNTFGGEIFIITEQGVENSEARSFDLRSSSFILETNSQPQTVVQGVPLTFDFTLTTNADFSIDSYGIDFVFDGWSCNYDSNCTLSPTSMNPAAGQTIPVSLTIDTSKMPPGHYSDNLQTIANSYYARFAKFEFDVTPKGESPIASGMAEFQGDGSIESGMGLPKYRVNLATLDPVLETCLFRMKTHGPPIRLNLWYLGPENSVNGLFGPGWRLNYESAISHDDRSATLFTTNGKILYFTTWQSLQGATETNPVTLTPPSGNYDTLTSYGTYFEYVEKSTRLRYRYEQAEIASTKAYLTTITDRNSQVVSLQTNKETGRISSISDSSGRKFTLNYNGDNKCVSVIAPDSRYYSFSFVNGRLSSISDPAGYMGRYSYDVDGFMTLMSTAGKQTRFTYSARPGLIGDKFVQYVTDPEGKQTKYEFKSGEPGVIKVLNSRGKISEHHNSGGKPTLSIDPTGELRQIGYENQKPVMLSDESGTSRMEYDSRGNLTRLVDALQEQTVMTYDSDDNLLTRTDALDNTWLYQYDSKNNLTQVTDPLAGRITIARDTKGRITTVTDQGNNTRRIFYDTWGNPTSYTDPLGNVTQFVYGNNGMRLSRIVDANGDYKVFTYDKLDRVTMIEYMAASTNKLLGVRSFTWDAFGSTGFTNELGLTYTNTRDAKGQIASITDPEGGITYYEYDSVGNRVKITDALGRMTTNEYDAANRLNNTKDPLGQITQRKYDAGGRLQELRDPNTNLTFWKYDARGGVVLERDALGEIVQTERDSLGRPSRRFNARGDEIQYSYDKLGNMTRKSVYGQGAQYDYVFDPLGNLTGMTGPDGTTTYEYTDRGEVSSISYPNGAKIQFTYDMSGNPLTITYPDGQAVSYQYDNFNRIAMPEILRNAAGEFMGMSEPSKKPVNISWASGNITLDYNAASMPVKIARSSGIDTTLSYDKAGRHAQISHSSASTNLEDMQMQFNLAGEMVSQSIAGTAIFPAMPAGTAAINSLNQISNWSGAAYTYDVDGNLTTAGGRFTAIYDVENRLTSLIRGTSTFSYSYNGLGHRVSRTGGSARKYLYDRAGQLLCIMDGAGNVVYNVVYAGAAVVAYGSSTNGYKYPLFDSSGNVTALTDGSGAVVASYRYLPFGQVQRTGSAVDNPFTFSGIYGVLDQGNGIYAMRRRFYDSTVGKFLQRDPIGITGGINLYTYSDNNPLIKIDPGGENPIIIGGLILWGASRLYNAWGTVKHTADAANKVSETIGNAKETAQSYGRAKKTARNLMNLNNQADNSLEQEIKRGYQMHDARQDTYNRGVEVKDKAMETAASAAQAGYHGARAIQGLIGAKAPVPDGLAGKASEMLTDAAFNEVDKEVIDWDTVPDPFE